jgi:hypothetical protein
VAHARRLTRARLSGWALCEDTCDTAALVVSELVTNAIVHAAGRRVVCELLDADDLVRIAVRDEGCAPGEPQPSPQRPEEEHGRGLLLVEAMCVAWGAQDAGPGLLVWANLPRGGRPAGAEDGSDSPSHCAAPLPAPSSLPAPASPVDSASSPTATARSLNAFSGMANGCHRDTTTGSDPGWSAKRPPADDRGNGAEASRGTEAMRALFGTEAAGASPLERSREWGGV